MLWSYCVGEGLTPFLDETLIPGFRVTSGDPTDDRLIQLRQRKREIGMQQCPTIMKIVILYSHLLSYLYGDFLYCGDLFLILHHGFK